MKSMSMFLFLIVMSCLLFIPSALGYATYEIDYDEFVDGYTADMAPGDAIETRILTDTGEETIKVTVLSVTMGSMDAVVSHNEKQMYMLDDDNFPRERMFELTEDEYYDILIRLDGITYNSPRDKRANVFVQQVHEGIPANVILPYSCWKYYECPDGEKIKMCDMNDQGCLCHSVSVHDCPNYKPPTCEKFFTCPDGSTVRYCERVRTQAGANSGGGGCGCFAAPEKLCRSVSASLQYATTNHNLGVIAGTHGIDDGSAQIVAALNPQAAVGRSTEDASEDYVVLIGGPCANQAVADLLANSEYTCSTWPLRAGKSLIKLIRGNKNYIIVAGTTEADTAKAAQFVKDFQIHDISADEMIV